MNMDGTTKYFYDTYALYEIIAGNPAYEKYKKGIIITSLLNLIEFHYSFSSKYGEEKAKEFLEIFMKECVLIEITPEIIMQANLFRQKNKPNSSKKKFSYPDAFGYTIAKHLGTKFLTGDEDFKGYENVEFIKN